MAESPDRASTDPSPGSLRISGAGDPAGLTRQPAVTFTFDGREVVGHPGESIAAALLAAGVRQLRSTRVDGRPRGLFCAIGTCFDCLVRIDGDRPVRACVTPVQAGLDVAHGDLDGDDEGRR